MTILTPNGVPELEKAAKEAGIYALDCETTGLNVKTDRLLCISFAVGERCWVVTFGNLPGAVSMVGVRDLFNFGLFADPGVKVVMHNAKFDLAVLANNGFVVQNEALDTMVAEWLTNEWGASPIGAKDPEFGLKKLVKKYFGKERFDYKEAATIINLDPKGFLEYAAEDAQDTWRLWHEIEEPALKRDGSALQKIFYKMEMGVVRVIMEMESSGLCVDLPGMEELLRKTDAELIEKQEEIWKLAGIRFKIESSEQLSDILFGKLGISTKGILEHKKSTAERRIYSTDQGYLSRLSSAHEIVPVLQAYKKSNTLRNNFFRPLIQMASHSDEKRIYPEFKQTGTKIGRLASARPNSQNMPRKGGIRDCIISPPGKVLICGDLNQVELRILAQQSRDPDLIKIYQENGDIHKRIMEITGVDRPKAKTVSFGVLYGLSPESLAQFLKVTEAKARKYYDQWYEIFKCVPKYREKVKIDVRRNGYVRTIWGRRRRFQGVPMDAYADRQAFHMTISGSAADAIKIGMCKLHRNLLALRAEDARYNDVRILAQVHDEILMESPEILAKDATKLLKDSLEDVGGKSLLVDIKAEVGSGNTWSSAKH